MEIVLYVYTGQRVIREQLVYRETLHVRVCPEDALGLAGGAARCFGTGFPTQLRGLLGITGTRILKVILLMSCLVSSVISCNMKASNNSGIIFMISLLCLHYSLPCQTAKQHQ